MILSWFQLALFGIFSGSRGSVPLSFATYPIRHGVPPMWMEKLATENLTRANGAGFGCNSERVTCTCGDL